MSEEEKPDNANPDRETVRSAQQMAIGLLAAVNRGDTDGAEYLLKEWDRNCTAALATLTLSLAKKMKGDDTDEWLRKIAFNIATHK